MRSPMLLRELTWLAPFVCVGLIVLAALRTLPALSAPTPNRMVTDAEGVKVAVPLPFRAITTLGASGFLETTHAPEVLLKGGSTRDRDFWFASGLMARIYPQVLHDDTLWDCPSDLEALLAHFDAATFLSPWLSGNRGEPVMRRIGLSALALGWHSDSKDEAIFTAVRIEHQAMAQADRGEAFIKTYQQAYADLKQDLHPETLTHLPRVLGMGTSGGDWSFLFITGMKEAKYDGQERAGVENATESYENTGRQQDAERILAMNPDIVFLRADRKLKFPNLESVSDFLHDPRWQGLTAVQNNRVYNTPRSLTGSVEPIWGLDVRPIWARWMAEIAHPDRLQPKARKLLREHFSQSYGYALSEDELDDLLRIFENKNAPGYTRFMANDLANTHSEASQ